MINKSNLLDAAQIITQGATKPDLYARIRGVFQVRPPPTHEIYENILDVDLKVIITTNYDEFLEKNFEHFNQDHEAFSVRYSQSDNLLNDLRSPIRRILKIHGCVSDPAKIILDRSSYFRAQTENPGVFKTVQALMTINTVMFIGYSISDPDIQIILENAHMFSQSEHPDYAIMAKPEHQSIARSMKETYNIELLTYPQGQHA